MAEFLSHLAKAWELGQPARAEITGTVEALRAAQASASQNKEWMKDLYRAAFTLAHGRIWAGDMKTPGQFVTFLTQGCGEAVEPWTLHTDLAALCNTIGDFNLAEASIASLAPLIKTDDQAGTWCNLLWELLNRRKTPDEAVAVLKHLAPLAPPPAAKAKLAETMVAGTRSWLTGDGFRRGLKILETTRDLAADSADLKTTIKLLGHLAKAHQLGVAKKIDDCVEELKVAQALAADDPELLRSVYAVARVQAGARASWKDRISCDKLVKFILEGPGKAVEPFTLHWNLAWIHLDLG